MLISYFDNPITSKHGQVPKSHLELSGIMDLLRSDALAEKIQKIRELQTKDEQNEVKRTLPYVTFSGKFFPTRHTNNLVGHSGLMSLDFDGVENLPETRVQLQSDAYVRGCFVSPRGNGLKVLVEIQPCDVAKHKEFFHDLSQYFQQNYSCAPAADESCSDVTRPCFLSHDPEAYYNPDSKEYKLLGLATPQKIAQAATRKAAPPSNSDAKRMEMVVSRIEAARVSVGNSYQEWLLIGFAMATLGEEGRELYHRVSVFHPEYDAGACDKKFDNYLKTTRFTTAAKFYAICKEYGVDISNPKQEVTGRGKAPATPVATAEKQPKKKRKERPDDSDGESISNVLYNSSGGISIFGNKNWVRVAEDFQIFVKYCTEDENEQLTWILELQPTNKDPIYLEVNHETFCSAKKLKDGIAAKRLSLKITDVYLGELHAYLFKTKFATAEKVSRFGWHLESKVFFFANKAVVGPKTLAEPDEFGIVKAGEYYLSIPVTNKKKINRFTLTESEMTFNKWFSMLAAAHKRENVLLPACFYLMSVFRDVIVAHTKASPILYLKGGASTGKSSIIRSISNLFGFEQQGVNLKNKNTEAALVRLMSQASNTVIWFDEYHNEFPYEGLLQAAYDNDGYHRASDTTSSATDSVDIYSALALTSNYLPDNPIFFSRCVFCPIVEQKKNNSQIEAFNKLRDAEKVGFGAVTVEILGHRALIERAFNRGYEQLYNALKKALTGESVVERLISNMARVMAPAYALQAEGMINMEFEVADEPSLLEEFVEIGVANIRRQNYIASEKTALSEFWEVVQLAYEQGLIFEGVHFRFDGGFLLLRFPRIYPIYQQKFRQVNFKPGADRDTLRQEVLAFEQGRDQEEVLKSARFLPEDLSNTGRTTKIEHNCWSVSYKQTTEKFGIDLKQK